MFAKVISELESVFGHKIFFLKISLQRVLSYTSLQSYESTWLCVKLADSNSLGEGVEYRQNSQL